MVKHKYILTDELSHAPVRIQIREVICEDCGETFFIEKFHTVHYCPFCKKRLKPSINS